MRSFFMVAMLLCIGLLTIAVPAQAISQASAAQQRDPWLWPFAHTSIWNMPIGSAAEYAPANFTATNSFNGDNVYLLRLSPADPLRPVYGHNSWGPGRCSGSPSGTNWPVPDDFIVPDAGQGNPDGLTPNNPFAFLLLDGETVFEAQVLARCEAEGPLYMPSWLEIGGNPQKARRSIYGDGITSLHGDGGFGHGASGMSALGGTIRLGELSGAEPIRHALKFTLWAALYLSYDADDPTPGYRWPATGADSYAGDPGNPAHYQGTNPLLEMGTLLALHPDLTPAELGLETEVGRKLFAAMQTYGIYIVEDSAWDQTLLVWEKGVEQEINNLGLEPDSGSLKADFNRLFQALSIVTNNGPDSIGGGGTPLAPLAPPFFKPTAFVYLPYAQSR